MNAAGIDVSSSKSTVAVLRPFGEVVKLPFDVRHSVEELASLAKQLKSIEGETRVVMEHMKPGFTFRQSILCLSKSTAIILSARSRPIRQMR